MTLVRQFPIVLEKKKEVVRICFSMGVINLARGSMV